jgi:hypothetical protein
LVLVSVDQALQGFEIERRSKARRVDDIESRRPAPMARATEEATPEPSPPFDIMVISMKIGNTSAAPASASVPRKPT